MTCIYSELYGPETKRVARYPVFNRATNKIETLVVTSLIGEENWIERLRRDMTELISDIDADPVDHGPDTSEPIEKLQAKQRARNILGPKRGRWS